jgi:polysaccharide deacetylase 2 family uncharacterized protein YibQ
MKHYALFGALALAGMIVGYSVGNFFERPPKLASDSKTSSVESASKKPLAWHKKQQASSQLFQEIGPEAHAQAKFSSRPRSYEESLPRDIYISPNPSLHKEDLVLDTPESFFPTEEIITPQISNRSIEDPYPKQADLMGFGIISNKKEQFEPIPAWQRYALAFQPKKGVPAIAIVIDDMGVDLRRSAKAIKFQGPLTLSFLTYAKQLKGQGEKARAKGHEVMLHVAMEPRSRKVDPGPNVLLVRDRPEVTLKRLRSALDQFHGFVGINNHMGSKFTSHSASMQIVIGELKLRGLMFLDSRTGGKTVGGRLARLAGVPYAERNVFLDHDDDVEKIKSQLKAVERLARRRGSAIAIGHPRDATLQVLEEWLPSVVEKGFQLVPISWLARITRRKV